MEQNNRKAWLYLLPAFTNCFQGYFRGMARFKVTVAATLLQVTLRCVFTRILAPGWCIRGIAAACGIGWSCMMVLVITYYVFSRAGAGPADQSRGQIFANDCRK